MAFPQVPMLLFTDTTTWQQVTSWSTDRAAGRVPNYGPMGPALPCAVDTSSAETVDAHGRQAMVVQHTVTFDDATFPGLHIRDQGVWVEYGKTWTVVGVQPSADATGRIWVVTCEERPLQ